MNKIGIHDIFSISNIEKAKKLGRKSKGKVYCIDENNYNQYVDILKYESLNRIIDIDYALEMKDSKICIFSMKDKIFQLLIKSAIDDKKVEFLKNVTGYLKGKSVMNSINSLIDNYKNTDIRQYYRLDVKEFFGSINHDILLKELTFLFDDNVMEILKKIIKQKIISNHLIKINHKGILYGSILSPIFSNIYMKSFDEKVNELAIYYTRYSDDILFSVESKSILKKVRNELARIDLKENIDKSCTVDIKTGFFYLGYYVREKKTMKSEERIKNDIVNKDIDSLNKYINYIEIDDMKKIQNNLKEDLIYNIIFVIVSQGKKYLEIQKEYKYAEVIYECINEVSKSKGLYFKLNELKEILFSKGIYDLAEEINSLIGLKEEVHKFSVDNINYDLYIFKLLKVRDEHFVLYKDNNGQIDKYKINEKICSEDINEMIAEKKAIGVCPTLKEDMSYFYVIDIDIDKRFFIEFGEEDEKINIQIGKCFDIALNIKKILAKQKINGYIEKSGMKGYHIWILFSKKIYIREAYNYFQELINSIIDEEFINIEFIPKMQYDDDEIIKIPFSFHPITKRQALFVDESNNIINKQLEYIEKMKYSVIPQKKEVSLYNNEKNKEIFNYTEPINSVLKNCSLINEIIQKGLKQNYLTHFERNALLYIFGHMGDDGKKYIHYIMSKTINYSRKITDAYISKIKKYPVSCQKLIKRFENIYNTDNCKCNFSKFIDFYDSPIIYAYEEDPDNVSKPLNIDSISKLVKNEEKDDKKQIDLIIEKIIKLNKEKNELERELKYNNNKLNELMDKDNIYEVETNSGKVIRKGRDIFIKIL